MCASQATETRQETEHRCDWISLPNVLEDVKICMEALLQVDSSGTRLEITFSTVLRVVSRQNTSIRRLMASFGRSI